MRTGPKYPKMVKNIQDIKKTGKSIAGRINDIIGGVEKTASKLVKPIKNFSAQQKR